MTTDRLTTILMIGETVAVEFKRCGGNIEGDVYETVCSFSNRFGGDIFLGVNDDGTIEGVPSKNAPAMVRNFVSVVSNPTMFSPTLYLEPEIIEYQGKTIIHIHVPTSGEVHSFKKQVYDRANDSDVKVKSTAQIAQMYIRKQEIYTERRVFPYLKKEDLKLEMLPRLRIMAVNNAGGQHPWQTMTDDELLQSARLYMEDPATGQKGYNLAAAMLLGRDEVVLNVCPAYVTDALLRKINIDRYDDRDIVQCNLIESYNRLFDFAIKHLPDKFYVEDTQRKSLRNIIVREMISNTLMHREFTSAFQAKFVIEKTQMYVENANRAKKDGYITPDNLEPYPKNPIIASFFRTIGYADQLGSGVRKMFRYTKLYSGENPTFAESDIFRITVPLDELYSFDALEPDSGGWLGEKGTEKDTENEKTTEKGTEKDTENEKATEKGTEKGTEKTTENGEKATEKITDRITDNQKKILCAIKENPFVTQNELAEIVGILRHHISKNMTKLQQMGLLKRIGGDKGGHWEIIKK
ncbi:MAG: putative DNA binding domain-containing protein [Bacteroidales bacterium]|nr:putative DNA binding domain-containing protein [Bacteroidales bacterium]